MQCRFLHYAVSTLAGRDLAPGRGGYVQRKHDYVTSMAHKFSFVREWFVDHVYLQWQNQGHRDFFGDSASTGAPKLSGCLTAHKVCLQTARRQSFSMWIAGVLALERSGHVGFFEPFSSTNST